MRVEVVYALPERHDSIKVDLPEKATVGEALAASGIRERHPGIDLSRVGIFGRAVKEDSLLADGDRVEIYRPLAFDPKVARRQRARRRR